MRLCLLIACHIITPASTRNWRWHHHQPCSTVYRMQDCRAESYCHWPRIISTSPSDHWWIARIHQGYALQPFEVPSQCLHPDSWRWPHPACASSVNTTIRTWLHSLMSKWRPQNYGKTLMCAKNVLYWPGLGKDVEHLIAVWSPFPCFKPMESQSTTWMAVHCWQTMADPWIWPLWIWWINIPASFWHVL